MNKTLLWVSRVSLGIPYRVVIIPMKKLSIAMATVNPWVCVSGEMGDSGVRQISKNTQEIFFQVCTHSAQRLTSHCAGTHAELHLNCGLCFITVQKPGQAEHPSAGNGKLWLTGQVSHRLCDGVQWDHWTHVQVSLHVKLVSSLC